MLETKGICPHCGREISGRPYLMALNPEAPGLVELVRQWFDPDEKPGLLGALALFAVCLAAGAVLGTLVLAVQNRL